MAFRARFAVGKFADIFSAAAHAFGLGDLAGGFAGNGERPDRESIAMPGLWFHYQRDEREICGAARLSILRRPAC